jgi:hypothetical protein
MKIIFLCAYLLGAIVVSTSAQASTVVAYLPGNGASVGPTVVGAGVTGNNLTRGSGIVENTGGDFNSRGWTVGGDAATALANDDYLLWGFTSTLAYDLTTLDIRYDRSDLGPTNMEIAINVNNAGFTTIFSDASVSASSEEHAGIDLSAYTNVTSAVFRLVAFGATLSSTGLNNGTFDIENTASFDGANGLVVSGTAITPIPAALPLFASGLGALGLIGWRRKRRTQTAISA